MYRVTDKHLSFVSAILFSEFIKLITFVVYRNILYCTLTRTFVPRLFIVRTVHMILTI